ncbi:Adenylate kinase isoenzyme [Dirofilaria immitis]
MQTELKRCVNRPETADKTTNGEERRRKRIDCYHNDSSAPCTHRKLQKMMRLFQQRTATNQSISGNFGDRLIR